MYIYIFIYAVHMHLYADTLQIYDCITNSFSNIEYHMLFTCLKSSRKLFIDGKLKNLYLGEESFESGSVIYHVKTNEVVALELVIYA